MIQYIHGRVRAGTTRQPHCAYEPEIATRPEPHYVKVRKEYIADLVNPNL